MTRQGIASRKQHILYTQKSVGLIAGKPGGKKDCQVRHSTSKLVKSIGSSCIALSSRLVIQNLGNLAMTGMQEPIWSSSEELWQQFIYVAWLQVDLTESDMLKCDMFS